MSTEPITNKYGITNDEAELVAKAVGVTLVARGVKIVGVEWQVFESSRNFLNALIEQAENEGRYKRNPD